MLQDHFRTGLLEETELLKVEATKLNEKFLLHGPFTSDNTAEGKYLLTSCNCVIQFGQSISLFPFLLFAQLLSQ